MSELEVTGVLNPLSSPPPRPAPHQEQQVVVVCQMLQQQRQRELQRLTLTGALTSTPNSPMIAQSPNLLSSATASPLQGGQGGSLFGLQDNALHKPGVSNTAGLLITVLYVVIHKSGMWDVVQLCFQAAGEKGGDKNGWCLFYTGAAHMKISGITAYLKNCGQLTWLLNVFPSVIFILHPLLWMYNRMDLKRQGEVFRVLECQRFFS